MQPMTFFTRSRCWRMPWRSDHVGCLGDRGLSTVEMFSMVSERQSACRGRDDMFGHINLWFPPVLRLDSQHFHWDSIECLFARVKWMPLYSQTVVSARFTRFLHESVQGRPSSVGFGVILHSLEHSLQRCEQILSKQTQPASLHQRLS